MKVICYGDSNTYGFDPRGWLGGRYGADDRWVDILARRTGWEILNGGLNGRETPPQTPAFPADTDLLMVMLGTNDLLQGRTPSETAQRMLRFLAGLGVRFADAGAWGVGLAYNGVHFTEQGHRAFAEGIWKELIVSPSISENASPNTPC